jgi:hypothetical protein
MVLDGYDGRNHCPGVGLNKITKRDVYINTSKYIHSHDYSYGLSKSDLFVIVLFLENTKKATNQLVQCLMHNIDCR